jgi:hypothetical protein
MARRGQSSRSRLFELGNGNAERRQAEENGESGSLAKAMSPKALLVCPQTASGEDTYVLCEINVSSCFAVPDQAPRPSLAWHCSGYRNTPPDQEAKWIPQKRTNEMPVRSKSQFEKIGHDLDGLKL